ncbi:hypothetical protein [Streptomyces poonensis]|nr:hypothetical protein [Streptomyces poonensis]
MLLGSVSLTVAAHADWPVIVLRGGHNALATPGRHGPVVLGVGEHEGPQRPSAPGVPDVDLHLRTAGAPPARCSRPPRTTSTC